MRPWGLGLRDQGLGTLLDLVWPFVLPLAAPCPVLQHVYWTVTFLLETAWFRLPQVGATWRRIWKSLGRLQAEQSREEWSQQEVLKLLGYEPRWRVEGEMW